MRKRRPRPTSTPAGSRWTATQQPGDAIGRRSAFWRAGPRAQPARGVRLPGGHAQRPLVRAALSLNGLSRVYRAGVHHASAIQVKRNILRSCFIPHPETEPGRLHRLGAGLPHLRQRLPAGGAEPARQCCAMTTCAPSTPGARWIWNQYWWIAQPGQEQALPAGRVQARVMEADINQEDLRHPRLRGRAQLHPAQRVGHPVPAAATTGTAATQASSCNHHRRGAEQGTSPSSKKPCARARAWQQLPATSCSTPRAAARTRGQADP